MHCSIQKTTPLEQGTVNEREPLVKIHLLHTPGCKAASSYLLAPHCKLQLSLMTLVEYGWTGLKTVEKVEIGWKLLKRVEQGWKRLKMVESGWKRLNMFENCCKYLEIVGKGRKPLKMAEHGWKGWKLLNVQVSEGRKRDHKAGEQKGNGRGPC